MKGLFVLVATSLPLLFLSMADACSVDPYPQEFEVDLSLAEFDTTPPSDPVIKSIEVERSDYPPPGNGDCGDLGGLSIEIELVDDQSAADQIGVEVSVEGNVDLLGIDYVDYPFVVSEGWVHFIWQDDCDEELSFELSFTAVDQAGNRSGATVAKVEEPSSSACGSGYCSVLAPGSRRGGAIQIFVASVRLAELFIGTIL